MKKNGYTVVELAIVLGIFSICYFTATWVISSKLNVNYEEGMYSQKIACIENNAVLYAKANDKLFEKDKTIYVTVDDLAKANAVISSDGEVIDPRDEIKQMSLRSDVLTIDDLEVGMQLEGTVRNVTAFGAFVDIGLHDDGLVHISKMSKSYVKHPSEILKVGDIITVYVCGIDKEKGRVNFCLLYTSPSPRD